MTPTGWHDPAMFYATVFIESPSGEPMETSRRRLEEAVATCAFALGVRAALTPQLVRYAYRHCPSLAAPEGAEVRRRRRTATPDEVVARLELRNEARRYWDEMERRVCRMKEEGLTE